MFDNPDKKIDDLHYEIGGYLDEIRILKRAVGVQQQKIEYLANILKIIRDEHRKQKQYDISDALRTILTNVGVEVKDQPDDAS